MMQTGAKTRLNTLTSENKEMRNVIEQLTAENRRLRRLEIRQTKALQNYEKSEYSLPGIMHHHQKQTEGLKEQIKKNQSTSERHERRSRQLEDELAKKTAVNESLKKMAARGGDEAGDRDAEVLRRRNEELKQKAETAEKEITSLRKHVDNLTRNHRREIASMQKKEKETMATMLSLQEKCKDSTKLLQLRDKEASLNNIYALRRERGRNPPRARSVDRDKKAPWKRNSEEEEKPEMDSATSNGREIGEAEAGPAVGEEERGNGGGGDVVYRGDFVDDDDDDDDDGDAVETASLIAGIRGEIQRLEEKSESPENAEKTHLIATHPAGVNDFSNHSTNDSSPKKADSVSTSGLESKSAAKRPLKTARDNLPPLVVPRPPTKPKEKPTATEDEVPPPVPSSPAGMRLIDYESRMSKIRQKNQEKLSELRRKLDAQLGVGGKGGTKGGREKKGKEELGFKFPYDTLRRRRKEDDDEMSVLPTAGKREEEDNDAEVKAICAEGDDSHARVEGQEEGPEVEGPEVEAPPRHVVDYVMAWDSGRGMTPETETKDPKDGLGKENERQPPKLDSSRAKSRAEIDETLGAAEREVEEERPEMKASSRHDVDYVKARRSSSGMTPKTKKKDAKDGPCNGDSRPPSKSDSSRSKRRAKIHEAIAAKAEEEEEEEEEEKEKMPRGTEGKDEADGIDEARKPASSPATAASKAATRRNSTTEETRVEGKAKAKIEDIERGKNDGSGDGIADAAADTAPAKDTGADLNLAADAAGDAACAEDTAADTSPMIYAAAVMAPVKDADAKRGMRGDETEEPGVKEPVTILKASSSELRERNREERRRVNFFQSQWIIEEEEDEEENFFQSM